MTVAEETRTHVGDDDEDMIGTFGKRYGIPKNKVIGILCATAFRLDKDGNAPSVEQVCALIAVCNIYELNPFTKEIFAFPDKHKGVIPVVSVDGWLRIINSRPELDGFDFTYSTEMVSDLKDQKRPGHAWIECTITRKDRAKPIVVREYLEECYRPASSFGPGPWQSHTNRFLRHKALIQCARYAFGFAGIYDEDEAQRILRADDNDLPPAAGQPLVEMPEETSAINVAATINQVVDKTLERRSEVASENNSAPVQSIPATDVVVAEAGKKMDEIKSAIDTITPPKHVRYTDGVKEGSHDKKTWFPIAETIDPATGEIVAGPPAGPVATPAKAEPIPAGRREMLLTRMEFHEVDDDKLTAKFGFGIDGVTVKNFAEVANWVEAQ